VLPSVTLWAVAGGTSLPWLADSDGRGPDRGPGGPPFGGMPPGFGDGGDIASIVYQACVHELGERVRPTARLLVQKIMDGTAGEVPMWGYEILACATTDSVETLVSHLADDNMVMRERAAVALGYMGPAACGAREQVAAAMGKAPSEREKRLLGWCLREIDRG